MNRLLLKNYELNNSNNIFELNIKGELEENSILQKKEFEIKAISPSYIYTKCGYLIEGRFNII